MKLYIHILAMDPTGYVYTRAKIALALQIERNPIAALWGYLTNTGLYAQYKAASDAFIADQTYA